MDSKNGLNISKNSSMLAFGPVPSRRLGQSLGINNILPKICSYSCIYCQLGRTAKITVKRDKHHPSEKIFAITSQKIQKTYQKGDSIDFLTFVADGEPTLDEYLGQTIARLKPLGIKIAVITNASLLWRKDVRQDLMAADLVSVKVDAIQEKIWRKINRPGSTLSLNQILEGVRIFAQSYPNELIAETMLVRNINDSDAHLEKLSGFLAALAPARIYVSVPTRPPAEKWVRAPSEATIARAYYLIKASNANVECLLGYEGNAFACSGDVEDDLLSIMAVHPMREEALQQFIIRAEAERSIVDKLVQGDLITVSEYDGVRFYTRKLKPGAVKS